MRVINQGERLHILDERFYTLDNEKFYPSVTTVLQSYPKGDNFSRWLKGVGFNADHIVQKAGEEGTRIHDAIEKFLTGKAVEWETDGVMNYNLTEWKCIMRFKEFHDIFKPETIAVERVLVDAKLKLGGTMDYVCRLNGVVWYIDFKSSNAIHTTSFLQNAAYVKMWNDSMEDKIEKAGTLWLKAKTRKTAEGKLQGKGWQVKESPKDLKADWTIFRHCHAIWRRENPTFKPLNLTYPTRIQLGGEE